MTGVNGLLFTMSAANKDAHPFYARMAAVDARARIHWRPPSNRKGSGFEYPSGARYIIDSHGAHRRQPKASKEEATE